MRITMLLVIMASLVACGTERKEKETETIYAPTTKEGEPVYQPQPQPQQPIIINIGNDDNDQVDPNQNQWVRVRVWGRNYDCIQRPANCNTGWGIACSPIFGRRYVSEFSDGKGGSLQCKRAY